jgi:LytS/YehU family sensor histidine kinase
MWLYTALVFLQDSVRASTLLKQQDDQVQQALLLALIPVVVAFSFFVFVFYRSKREAAFREKEAAFKLNIAEGELKALRAQMNPHFIFNCMNSIHHYMHTNPSQAADYLIKFSQLIRHVLESSAQRLVPLNDEIEANRNYMSLEQLRMNHAFEFHFEIDGLNAEAIHVPPMVIQPFVENSIWHGFALRGSGGRVDIRFSKQDTKHILCVIKDNGHDESVKSEMDLSHVVKKTSMGITLIQERLNNLNALYGTQARFEIVKNADEGKSIHLLLPFDE